MSPEDRRVLLIGLAVVLAGLALVYVGYAAFGDDRSTAGAFLAGSLVILGISASFISAIMLVLPPLLPSK